METNVLCHFWTYQWYQIGHLIKHNWYWNSLAYLFTIMIITYRTPVYFYIIYRQILTIIFHTNLLIIFGTLRDKNLSRHIKDLHIVPILDFRMTSTRKRLGGCWESTPEIQKQTPKPECGWWPSSEPWQQRFLWPSCHPVWVRLTKICVLKSWHLNVGAFNVLVVLLIST